MQHPNRPPPLTFCLPICSASPVFKVARRTAAAAAAAFALCITPATPRPNLSLASAFAATTISSISTTTPPRSSTPVVVFDKDYSPHTPLWHLQHSSPTSAQTQLSLPPGPSISAELRVLTRLLVALVVGGFIGMERRAANSLAGVRTFSLVSLGAAIFMTTALVAFPAADPARVAAAISSSVGFLGAGAMQKNAKHHRGLTTASSVWLAAALGIAAASGMFLLSFAGAVSTVLIARYARFDSSLHLIRDDNTLVAPSRRNDPAIGHVYNGNGAMRSGLEYTDMNRSNGNHGDRMQAPFKVNKKPSGTARTDPVHLQALVDYDPTSQASSREIDDEDHDTGPPVQDSPSRQ